MVDFSLSPGWYLYTRLIWLILSSCLVDLEDVTGLVERTGQVSPGEGLEDSLATPV